MWTHSAYKQGDVTDADLQDAINAAAVVGDDFLSEREGRLPAAGGVDARIVRAAHQHWVQAGSQTASPWLATLLAVRGVA